MSPIQSSSLTMSEIAAELGLSRKTISAVINGPNSKRYVNVETAQRVREHMERRGYVPSRAARQLRAGSERVVGILHVNTIYTHLVEASHQLARVFSGSTPGGGPGLALEIIVAPWQQLKLAVQELKARRVTDLVWIHDGGLGEEFRNPDIANYLSNMRTVIYNYDFDSPHGEKELLDRGIALVGVDRMFHTRKLARFLKEMGHQNIALPEVLLPNNRYFEMFEGVGLTIADCPSSFTPEGMLKAMKEQGVTAACFHGDSLACLALNRLRNAGIRVPEDLTVTGFDGMARNYNLDLTTLAMPVDKMVAKVCEFVDGREAGLSHCIDMQFLKGRTHGAPRE